MYADFRYAWGDKQTRFCKCLQAIEIMIHNVDMPLLFWWGGKETWTPSNGLTHERT
jgi:hypothetical protein